MDRLRNKGVGIRGKGWQRAGIVDKLKVQLLLIAKDGTQCRFRSIEVVLRVELQELCL